MGKMQRTKGAGFERKIAKVFRELYPDAKRNLEYQGELGELGTDVIAGPFRIQCKRMREYAPVNKINEVRTDINTVSLLITKADRKEAVVVLSLTNFMKILKGNLDEFSH